MRDDGLFLNKTGEMSLPEAADLLFAQYSDLSTTDYWRAADAFATWPQPYFDGPRGRWLVGSYDLCRDTLRDPTLSNNLCAAASQTNSDRLRHRLAPDEPSLLFIDPPEHDRMKVELSQLFRRDAIDAHEEWLEGAWSSAASRLASVPNLSIGADWIHPVCLDLTYRILGLPGPSVERVEAITEDLYAVNRLFDLNISNEERLRSRDASVRIRDEIASILPGSAVERAMFAAGASDGVVLSTVVFMLRAGVVTLGSLLMSAVAELLSGVDVEPAQCAGEVAAESLPGLHELLIRHTPTQDTGRVTVEPTQIGDTTIPPFSTIIALIGSAHHALHLPGRSLAGNLVFGSGTHRCVGERLVRKQLEFAMRQVTTHRGQFSVQAVDVHRTPSFRGYRDIRIQRV